MYGFREVAEAGGLIAYGVNVAELCRRDLRGQDPQGRQASRPPCRAADQVRAGDQSQDRQGPWLDDPAVALTAGGSGDRVMWPGGGGSVLRQIVLAVLSALFLVGALQGCSMFPAEQRAIGQAWEDRWDERTQP